MSESIALNSDPLSDAERVDVRRYCGYPAYGSGASGFESWRFFQTYGTLEYRLTNMAPSEYQVTRQYLSDLYTLEQAVTGASPNLDTAEAAVWKRNPSEVGDRLRLLDNWRRRLAAFIGVPPGPTLSTTAPIII